MPAMGMAMTEGILAKWLKEPGDPVTKGEAIAEIETDKANAEVESPEDGRLGPHLFEAGAVIPVGTPITRVEQGTGSAAATQTPAAESRQPTPASVSPSQPAKVTGPAAPARSATDRTSAVREIEQSHFARYRELVSADGDELREVDLTDLPRDRLVEWLERMALIRAFEERSDQLALVGKIPGGMHSAAGQEAVAVGSIRALAPTDIVTSTHRSHHHSLAKGLTPRSIMAELYGKATGCLGGRAGHMHLADFSLGLFGSNGIVGAGVGIAMGAALGASMRGLDQVALGFVGDGGANTGRTWEFINLASVWRLPLIVICENNLYAVETYVGRAMAAESIAKRAAGFGLPVLTVEGQDVGAVYRATVEARERARNEEGPTFIEALTYRYEGHNTGDKGAYREREEIELWRRTRDPVLRLKRALESADLLQEGQYDRIVDEARATVEDAVEFAEQSPWPDPATGGANVTGLPISEKGTVTV